MNIGNTWIHKTDKDFSEGIFVDTVLVKNNTGFITLAKGDNNYLETGTYTSTIINTEGFTKMVLSWNGDTPEGTSIKIEAQVLVNNGDKNEWSSWLPIGLWTNDDNR